MSKKLFVFRLFFHIIRYNKSVTYIKGAIIYAIRNSENARRTHRGTKALAEKVTAAVSETTGAPEENIVVFIEEMSKTIMQLAENA